ncbi:MAG: C4-type zinc ribbon domain-containing protein [Mobilicoccus sp.]|nr:C4-type zinc ribbon domain-containing protein [Mobilicoccus sp.]
MKADPQLQWRLLDLQAIDTRLAQIAHRVNTLPEATALRATTDEMGVLDSEITRAKVALDDVRREVDKAEADVALVRERAARNQSRLDAGQGTAKDLQALQHELESLARRQAELEEVELDVMERVEEAEKRLATVSERRAPLDARRAEEESARDAALRELDDEKSGLERQRGDVAGGVGAELLGLYEKIRDATGMGAAELRERRCEGCRLELMAADIDRIRKTPAETVVRCEECRRILVRTAESGL